MITEYRIQGCAEVCLTKGNNKFPRSDLTFFFCFHHMEKDPQIMLISYYSCRIVNDSRSFAIRETLAIVVLNKVCYTHARLLHREWQQFGGLVSKLVIKPLIFHTVQTFTEEENRKHKPRVATNTVYTASPNSGSLSCPGMKDPMNDVCFDLARPQTSDPGA